MRSKDDLKQQVCAAHDQRDEALITLGETIRHQPELGFKEFRTAALVAAMLQELGVPHRTGLAHTGGKGELRGARPGPSLALIGELDGLVVSGHPLADQHTGAAHACGHNVQVTGVLGAQVEITTLPGYMPLANDAQLSAIFRGNAEALVGPEHYVTQGHRTGSTDMGDLSQIMPAVQGYMGGATGAGHGADYTITEPRLAYLGTAKLLAMAAIDLLWDEAQEAQRILRGFTPLMSREHYLRIQRGLHRTEAYDGVSA